MAEDNRICSESTKSEIHLSENVLLIVLEGKKKRIDFDFLLSKMTVWGITEYSATRCEVSSFPS
jgi:hypothetical protein